MSNGSTSGGQPQGPPPHAVVLQLATNFMNSQVIFTFVDLEVADNLKDNTIPVNELATSLSCQSRPLYRLLRAGASLGLIEEVDFQQHTFKLTTAGQFLRDDHPMSLKNSVRMFMNPTLHQVPWKHLGQSVKTGENAFRKNFGKEFWDYLGNDHQEETTIFNDSMTALARGDHAAIVEAYDFSSIKMLVDVGGGHGALMTTILTANPALHGAVFELPSVIETEAQFVKPEEIRKRLEFHGGSFFESVAPVGDAYIMAMILHHWGDDDCIRILKNIHKALLDNGKVLIVDRVIVRDNAPSFNKMMDLNMLVLTDGGQERTEEEFRELLPKAGFKLSRIVQMKSMASLVEAIKVPL